MVDAGLLEDRKIELLNGLIVEMAPEGPEHAERSTSLNSLFYDLAKGRYRVREGKPITLPTSNSEPEPDIALVGSKKYLQAHPTPADIFLVVEFSQSSLVKDTEAKRLIYAAAGIKDYWVVDLRNRLVIVYRQPAGGDYQAQEEVSTGEIALLAFPDVTISVEELLEE